MELDEGVAEQLSEVNLNSSIQVRCGSANAFMVIASVLGPLIEDFEMSGVYISASRSAQEINEGLQSAGLDTSNIHFIDCISSGIVGGRDSDLENISFVDSPVMLENIILMTMYQMRVSLNERRFVILDSVNSLSIYNENRLLAEFLHAFINTFRQREELSIISVIPDQTPPGVLANLDLYCTDTIDRGQVVIS